MKNHSKTFTQVSKRKMIGQGLNVVAGVDVGDKHSQLCLIDLDGNIVERKKLRSSPAAFDRYFSGWTRLRVVLEAGTHANWVYRLLERLVLEPLMGDTQRLALITQSLSKDDSHRRRAAGGRGGPTAKRKAIVVVERKLAVLLHVLWRQDVDLDPFYRTNSRAAATNFSRPQASSSLTRPHPTPHHGKSHHHGPGQVRCLRHRLRRRRGYIGGRACAGRRKRYLDRGRQRAAIPQNSTPSPGLTNESNQKYRRCRLRKGDDTRTRR